MKRFLMLAGTILVVGSANAALVKYDFDGVVTDAYPAVTPGTAWKGSLSFDPDSATPDEEARQEYFDQTGQNLPYFKLNAVMTVNVGPYTLTGGPGKCLFSKGGFEFMDMPMGGDQLATNSDFFLRGDLFEQDPDKSLAGARWDRMMAPAGPWVLNTYGDDQNGESQTGEVWLKIARLTYSGGDRGLPGDAAPVPEPSSLVLLSAGLAGFAGFRKKRGKPML